MNIFDVFKPGEIDDLPDDPRQAFVEFVRRCQAKLDEFVATAVENDADNGWRLANEYRHDFMSMVIAAGKRFDIADFKSRVVPERQNWEYSQYEEFSAELNHYLTQVVLDNSIRGKRESVELSVKSKDRIRQHIHALKKLIDQADMDADKKTSMLVKLERFEQELEKRRLSMGAVGLLAITLLSSPGGVWQSWDLTSKLIHDVFGEVHEAQVAADERRLAAPSQEPAQLSPPRPAGFEGPSGAHKPAFESGGMDDDIPF